MTSVSGITYKNVNGIYFHPEVSKRTRETFSDYVGGCEERIMQTTDYFDSYSYTDHQLIGSTACLTKRPFMPYTLIRGTSRRTVLKQRRKNLANGYNISLPFPVDPKDFGIKTKRNKPIETFASVNLTNLSHLGIVQDFFHSGNYIEPARSKYYPGTVRIVFRRDPKLDKDGNTLLPAPFSVHDYNTNTPVSFPTDVRDAIKFRDLRIDSAGIIEEFPDINIFIDGHFKALRVDPVV